jgi:hypothetical protein
MAQERCVVGGGGDEGAPFHCGSAGQGKMLPPLGRLETGAPAPQQASGENAHAARRRPKSLCPRPAARDAERRALPRRYPAPRETNCVQRMLSRKKKKKTVNKWVGIPWFFEGTQTVLYRAEQYRALRRAKGPRPRSMGRNSRSPFVSRRRARGESSKGRKHTNVNKDSIPRWWIPSGGLSYGRRRRRQVGGGRVNLPPGGDKLGAL